MGYPAQEQFYVVVPATKSPALFTRDLASLAKRHGMKPHLGQATDTQGRTLYVLEANGKGMKLWGQNQPLDRLLSDHRRSVCGDHTLDPGQYSIMFIPMSPLTPRREATQLASRLKEELSAIGYEVRSEPLECSSFAIDAT
jgi:hypothetical protein